MPDLALITSLPEIKSAVSGDLDGGFLDAVNETDGETIAAVMGMVSTTLQAAGGTLGFGALRRMSLTGPAQATVVLIQGTSVITAVVDPVRALGAVEKILDSMLAAEG